MVLFTILSMILLLLIVFTVLAVSVGGAVAVVLFSDVIVCVALIAWIIKLLARKKKK